MAQTISVHALFWYEGLTGGGGYLCVARNFGIQLKEVKGSKTTREKNDRRSTAQTQVTLTYGTEELQIVTQGVHKTKQANNDGWGMAFFFLPV